jgi:sialate O-acetylesterase
VSTRRLLLAILVAAVTSAASLHAQTPVTLGPLFQDRAVLQRGQPIAIWGTAGPGEEVVVALAGKDAPAKADTSGRWTATLPPMDPGGPFTLGVRTASGATASIADVLVGDVFLCSGQSNMEATVAQSRGGGMVAARSANDKIRLLTVPHAGAPRPAAAFDPAPSWQSAGPQSVRTFSAACYYFGREIQETRNVPVGLIQASWAGTAIEPWMAESGLRAIPGFDARLDILREFATDETSAQQKYGHLWEDWWRLQAPAAGTPWMTDAPGDWTVVPALTNWKTWGVPVLAKHDGMVWHRRVVTLTPEQAAKTATLALGGIDEVDQTWVNGRIIRNTFGWGTKRSYHLPAATLHAGDNVIVVNVLSTWDAGGLVGPADAMAIEFDDGTKLPIGEGWTYRAVPLAVGRAPRAPWETIAGLTTLYNGMIAPIGTYGIRAVLWYQGETNADAPAGYERLLGGLMESWRMQFGAHTAFLVVQLPNFGAVPTKPVEASWADLREAQRRAVASDARAGLAVTIDIGEADDLHPSNKRDVGRRLARAARRVVYGESVAASGPVPLTARREPARVVVTFGDVERALVTYSSAQAIGFELCAAGPGTCRFVPANVDGARAILPVRASSGWSPTRVRFCWGPSPVCNLSDASGLPVGPFELAIRQ